MNLDHICIQTNEIQLSCLGTDCEVQVEGVIDLDHYEEFESIVSLIESDNGWEDGRCSDCRND